MKQKIVKGETVSWYDYQGIFHVADQEDWCETCNEDLKDCRCEKEEVLDR